LMAYVCHVYDCHQPLLSCGGESMRMLPTPLWRMRNSTEKWTLMALPSLHSFSHGYVYG